MEGRGIRGMNRNFCLITRATLSPLQMQGVSTGCASIRPEYLSPVDPIILILILSITLVHHRLRTTRRVCSCCCSALCDIVGTTDLIMEGRRGGPADAWQGRSANHSIHVFFHGHRKQGRAYGKRRPDEDSQRRKSVQWLPPAQGLSPFLLLHFARHLLTLHKFPRFSTGSSMLTSGQMKCVRVGSSSCTRCQRAGRACVVRRMPQSRTGDARTGTDDDPPANRPPSIAPPTGDEGRGLRSVPSPLLSNLPISAFNQPRRSNIPVSRQLGL